jgi:hypothetical protein
MPSGKVDEVLVGPKKVLKSFERSSIVSWAPSGLVRSPVTTEGTKPSEFSGRAIPSTSGELLEYKKATLMARTSSAIWGSELRDSFIP